MARSTKQTENKRNNLRNDIKRAKQTNFTQWHQQSDLKSTKVSQNREKVPKVPMDRVIWAQSKTKRNLSAEKNNHPKITIKRWTTTKRMWRNNQRIDWTNKTPKLLRRARCTKPLDALGLKTWNRWRKENNQRTKENSQSNRTPTHSGSRKTKKKNTDQT